MAVPFSALRSPAARSFSLAAIHETVSVYRFSTDPASLTRLIRLNALLGEEQRLTTGTLAEAISVSVRMIKRDIDCLRNHHGAEIRWDARASTYRCVKPSDRLPPLRISADEAIAWFSPKRRSPPGPDRPSGARLSRSCRKWARSCSAPLKLRHGP